MVGKAHLCPSGPVGGDASAHLCDALGGLSLLSPCPAAQRRRQSMPERQSLFGRKRDSLLRQLAYSLPVPTPLTGSRNIDQCVSLTVGVRNLPAQTESFTSMREGLIRLAEQPLRPAQVNLGVHPRFVSIQPGQRTMPRRRIEGSALLQVVAGLLQLS